MGQKSIELKQGQLPEQKPEKYACADCFEEINEGEYKTFGVCDKCWDKNYQTKKPEDIVASSGKEELLKEYYKVHGR
jgi:Zn finger protein HypA/HybF involved in hydrogenase expression